MLERPVDEQLLNVRNNAKLKSGTIKEVFDSVIVDYKKLKPQNINRLQGCFNNKINHNDRFTKIKSDYNDDEIQANDAGCTSYSMIE